MPETKSDGQNLKNLAEKIKTWGAEYGFQQVNIVEPDLDQASERLQDWLDKKFHGSMKWMAEHGEKRYQIDNLVDRTLRVISVRMDYLADSNMIAVLGDDNKAYISRYALGRDYHKLIRRRLAALVKKIELELPLSDLSQRPFVDSAPVMEKPIAEQAGLGWIGKNTLLLNQTAGSWFFLGEIYTSLALPVDNQTQEDKCGKCKACITVCPTDAFPEPYVLDARRCISYLTIEHKGSIDEELRPLMGNRVFGCDDCQIRCPWNRFASFSKEADFAPRHNLQDSSLVSLFMWSNEEFLKNTEGSPIRRIGHERWLRNLAVGLGNASASNHILEALRLRKDHPSLLVREHVNWAIKEQRAKLQCE
ncbi:tRNA epoxyqueuosine(34) reductase QueG [Porticoccaceae bacterium]|nr:tRNA epoxyqueuosine(34) reductase QueG [Porticoccaceae bacterium]MDB2486467.1 tRNA epoxyqueuosine(34) reductase QueG [Porticoccaceae bacterium]MDB2635236.1 tRNA epoxyqueuosine(34) reductase QueG [Porticoccaceae bacterium]